MLNARGESRFVVLKSRWTGRSKKRRRRRCTKSSRAKHLRVHEGDRVRAGDRLTEGPVNPHDILRIKGPRAVQ